MHVLLAVHMEVLTELPVDVLVDVLLVCTPTNSNWFSINFN